MDTPESWVTRAVMWGPGPLVYGNGNTHPIHITMNDEVFAENKITIYVKREL